MEDLRLFRRERLSWRSDKCHWGIKTEKYPDLNLFFVIFVLFAATFFF